MSQEFNAIFEKGVLRPLTPIALREHEVVTVSVTSALDKATQQHAVARQRENLLAFVSEMEALPDELPTGGTTNRDHDDILYGEHG